MLITGIHEDRNEKKTEKLGQVYWGNQGQYGPYSPQEDGWPNAGEVVRDYRKRAGLSAKEFAQLYGKATSSQSVTNIRILQMENSNAVPNDITRRRAITTLLGIPPTLLGLASLDDTLKPTSSEPTYPHVLKKFSKNTQQFQNIAVVWQLHYTSSAASYLPHLLQAQNKLQHIRQAQSEGDFHYSAQELLYSHYRLVEAITCDQGDFQSSYTQANNAVTIAKQLYADAGNNVEKQEKSSSMLAAALYRRGFLCVEWGGRFMDSKGLLQPDPQKIKNAIQDFEYALKFANPQLKILILKELACAQSSTKQNTIQAQATIDQASHYVGKTSNFTDDPHMKILLNGSPDPLSEGWYRMGKIITLINTGRSATAIEEIANLERLKTGGIAKDQTRNQAWLNIVSAQASLGVMDYFTATIKATQALSVCQQIQSKVNIAIIRDIYHQLLFTSYKNTPEVLHLGRMLKL